MEQAAENVIAVEINNWATDLLYRKTKDEQVYEYQRKLQRRMQYEMFYRQWIPILFGLGLFKLTRRLKKSSGTDIFYFVAPYLYVNYGIFCLE